MKKILLAIPGNSSFLVPTVNTFKQLGWNVRNIDYRKTDIQIVSKNYINLPGLAIREVISKSRPSIKRIINNSEILRVAKSWQPDVFLTFKGEIILSETIQKLKKLNIMTICWYPDHLPDSLNNNVWLSTFDCFVYWDPWRTKKYHTEGFKNVFYLPFCTIPEKIPAPRKKKYEVNFVAHWQSHREQKIISLANYGIKIWGNKKWQTSKLAEYYQWGPVAVEEMIRIIRSSKITLNVHVVEQIYSEGTNVRTFETTGAGGFLLANKRESLFDLFDVGREIEVFDSEEELIEKTKFYLKNETARENIARAGWERAKKNHTYLKRFISLLKYLNL